ncbi:YciI family protein [Polycladidibacter stylochi]|uniref:YciI family protein n=1 Tax=Polycladidibacter stylochi TaxID=1807766 RepID=UPI00082AE66E|nr:hypothetical protein [Pseudovibrio stylochi]
MHIILLKFGDNKESAKKYMETHNSWISSGFSDGVFQCVGSLDSGGGFIIAHGESTDAIHKRVAEDPFAQHAVVTPEVHAIDVKRTVPQLDYFQNNHHQ